MAHPNLDKLLAYKDEGLAFIKAQDDKVAKARQASKKNVSETDALLAPLHEALATHALVTLIARRRLDLSELTAEITELVNNGKSPAKTQAENRKLEDLIREAQGKSPIASEHRALATEVLIYLFRDQI
ncbi:MAG TPA: hypothetical protein VD907_02235 [Verrucomicrobiae bacterium]|nr:hypothetical protein [Verrucomicrobiae bacterium]